ncbi:MAG: hypothetical protein WC250_03725, partial [Candidatus Paceibacterota bacterium]
RSDMDYPVAFNVMEDVGADKRHLVASGLMSTFKKIWVDAWSARMEYILNNTILALLEYPGATLLDVNRMLAQKDFRKKVVENIKDVSVKSFWVDEFAKYTDKFAAEATPAIQNKVGQFTSNPLIRNIIGQPKSTFDIRQMMDTKKILIINLSKGKVGETNANLLGSMMITKIYLGAMSRADVPEKVLKTLPNFYLYVDEFQSFANESFANILSEARKYQLNLTIAHQYVEQMSEEVRAAVFGNVGTMISFRVGAFDAELLEKEYAPQFTAEDMVNLGFAQIYLKLMIDGVSSSPFSALTLPPIAPAGVKFTNEIIKSSREQFAKPRVTVEEEIAKVQDVGGMGGKIATAPSASSSTPSAYPPRVPSQSSRDFSRPAGPSASATPSAPRSDFRSQSAPRPPEARAESRPFESRPAEPKNERPPLEGAKSFKEALTPHLAKIQAESVKPVETPKPISLNQLKKEPVSGLPKTEHKLGEGEASDLKKALADLIKTSAGPTATPTPTSAVPIATQSEKPKVVPVPKVEIKPAQNSSPRIHEKAYQNSPKPAPQTAPTHQSNQTKPIQPARPLQSAALPHSAHQNQPNNFPPKPKGVPDELLKKVLQVDKPGQ